MSERPPIIHDDRSPAPEPLPFPTPPDQSNGPPALRLAPAASEPPADVTGPTRDDEEQGGDVLARFDNVSRRIHDLARDLDCLGHFDDDDRGRPRAA